MERGGFGLAAVQSNRSAATSPWGVAATFWRPSLPLEGLGCKRPVYLALGKSCLATAGSGARRLVSFGAPFRGRA